MPRVRILVNTDAEAAGQSPADCRVFCHQSVPALSTVPGGTRLYVLGFDRRWTVVAPRMSATVLDSNEPGVVDSIHLGGTGGHFQNLTVQFPNASHAAMYRSLSGGGADRTASRPGASRWTG